MLYPNCDDFCVWLIISNHSTKTPSKYFLLLIRKFIFLFRQPAKYISSSTTETLDRRFLIALYFFTIIFFNNFFFLELYCTPRTASTKRNVCSSWSLTRNWLRERGEEQNSPCFSFSFRKCIGMRAGVSPMPTELQ